MGASLYETTLGLLLISPRWAKSYWLDVKNAQKDSMVTGVTGGKFRPLRPTNRSLIRPRERDESKSLAWKLFFRDARVTLCAKDTVSNFKKGI